VFASREVQGTYQPCLFIYLLIFMNLLIHCRAGRKTKRHNKATKCGKQNNSACRGHCGGLSPVQQLVAPVSYSTQSLGALRCLYLHNALNSR
jgi:hypothetical protein